MPAHLVPAHFVPVPFPSSVLNLSCIYPYHFTVLTKKVPIQLNIRSFMKQTAAIFYTRASTLDEVRLDGVLYNILLSLTFGICMYMKLFHRYLYCTIKYLNVATKTSICRLNLEDSYLRCCFLWIVEASNSN